MTTSRVQEVIDDLVGTAQDLGSVCEQHGFTQDQLTRDELAQIDDWIFECEVCGWWCGTDERFDAETCTDCHEAEEDE